MKKILSVDELHQAIQNQSDIYHNTNGKKFKFDIVRVLNTKFIDLITMIKDGLLFVESPY